MRVLITGSSGQIGTNLALRLLAEGHTVFGVDRRINPWTDAFPTLLQDLAAPQREFRGGIGGAPYPPCDILVHLAANAKVHELVEQPHRALENITLTFNVLEYCRMNGMPIVFASSREVYGDIHRYLTEETNADFSYTESPYSASKISGEALIYAYARCYGLRYVIFRFSNVYGRYDTDITRMERVIPLFINLIDRGEPVTVFGREKVLDFTYIDDCVDGIMRGVARLLAGTVTNRTINLAYGEGNSLVRMAELIGAALHMQPTIIVEPAKRPGEVSYYVADISLARELLDFVPQVPLEEGIRRAVAWAMHNKGGQ
jgi:nucleoside-diphosphate-sugar epimerase